jgi:hypothetical protein
MQFDRQRRGDPEQWAWASISSRIASRFRGLFS